MVETHYRWDFIGLSTDTKPTPETSEKVVDGSTFYCSDNSKLYVWCKNQWYEKEVSGGGGVYTAGDGIVIDDDEIAVDTDTIQEKLTAGTGIDITDNTISVTGGSGPTVVQTTGTSTADVMSQDAVSSTLFNDPIDRTQIKLGTNATSTGNRSTTIGAYAKNDKNFSVALGSYSSPTRVGEVNIGVGTTTVGYNSTSYRVLGGVHDPVDAHDAATKGYVDANAGGPTVVQTTGNSASDVMSQDATSKMVFNDPSACTQVKIGTSTSVSGNFAMSIGASSTVNGNSAIGIGYNSGARMHGIGIGDSAKGGNALSHDGAIGIGYNSEALSKGGVALGAFSSTSTTGEMNIGTSNTSYGYSDTAYRLLTGLYDGQSAHDAVTIGQINNLIDAINTATGSNISHIGV